MGMISHRAAQGDPAHEIAHSSILGRFEHKVLLIGYQRIRKNAAWIANDPLGKNVLTRLEIGLLVENNRTSIASIQGMVDRTLRVARLGRGIPKG